MKKLILSIALILTVAFTNAQTVAPKQADKVLRDTLVKGVKTQIFVGSRGGKYILVTSKAGNVYKKYLKK